MISYLFSGNKCITTGGNAPYKPCVFPFIYNGVKYNTCTYAGSQHTEGVAWCSTSTDNYDNHIQGSWGNCEEGSNCPLPSRSSPQRGKSKYGIVRLSVFNPLKTKEGSLTTPPFKKWGFQLQIFSCFRKKFRKKT